MTKSKVYPVILMVLVGLVQAYSAWTVKEVFPIAPFAMYSGRYDSENLQILRIACVKQQMKKEKFVAEFDRFLQEVDYTGALNELIYAALPLQEQAVTLVKSVLAPLRKDLQYECSSLKLYRYTWARFTGQKRFRPDKIELLYEMAW